MDNKITAVFLLMVCNHRMALPCSAVLITRFRLQCVPRDSICFSSLFHLGQINCCVTCTSYTMKHVVVAVIHSKLDNSNTVLLAYCVWNSL